MTRRENTQPYLHSHWEGPTWVMLHGFTQTGASMEELAGAMGVRGLAPDLPGHGPAPGRGVTLKAAVSQVTALLESQGGPTPLLGYSQGGRVALQVTLERPELVSSLVLLSASPGIAEVEARAQRRAEDEERAQELETLGLEAFLTGWATLPLFQGLQARDEAWRERDRAIRLTNTAEGLAAALRGLGQGQQEDLLPRLGELKPPTLFVAGARDAPYCQRALAMAEAAPRAIPVFLPGKGHALLGEAPQEVARVIRHSS